MLYPTELRELLFVVYGAMGRAAPRSVDRKHDHRRGPGRAVRGGDRDQVIAFHGGIEPAHQLHPAVGGPGSRHHGIRIGRDRGAVWSGHRDLERPRIVKGDRRTAGQAFSLDEDQCSALGAESL